MYFVLCVPPIASRYVRGSTVLYLGCPSQVRVPVLETPLVWGPRSTNNTLVCARLTRLTCTWSRVSNKIRLASSIQVSDVPRVPSDCLVVLFSSLCDQSKPSVALHCIDGIPPDPPTFLAGQFGANRQASRARQRTRRLESSPRINTAPIPTVAAPVVSLPHRSSNNSDCCCTTLPATASATSRYRLRLELRQRETSSKGASDLLRITPPKRPLRHAVTPLPSAARPASNHNHQHQPHHKTQRPTWSLLQRPLALAADNFSSASPALHNT